MQKTIALVGSNTYIGKCFEPHLDKSFILHPTETLDWKKPAKARQTIRKGNPDAYVICYSFFDQASMQLLEILRTVKKAAKESKAKIIGFVSSNMFAESDREVIDEGVEPFGMLESTRAEILYQDKLLNYDNALVFRIGEIWSEYHGLVTSYLRQLTMPEGLEIFESDVFSVTSGATIVSAVKTALQQDLVLYYNLADKGELSSRQVANLIVEALESCRFNEGHRRKYREGGQKLVLDSSRWEVMSMTELPLASLMIKQALPKIIEWLYENK